MASPVVLAAVFFLLSPGVLVTIPPFLPPAFFSGRTSVVAAAVHAAVF
jgi:D-lyxose ketol-isomerase